MAPRHVRLQLSMQSVGGLALPRAATECATITSTVQRTSRHIRLKQGNIHSSSTVHLNTIQDEQAGRGCITHHPGLVSTRAVPC